MATPSSPEHFEFRATGRCPICEAPAEFSAVSVGPIPEYRHLVYLRNYFACSGCASIPRERALFTVIDKFYPQWRSLSIHEGSPIERGTSPKLKKEGRSYLATQYDPHLGFGNVHPTLAYRSEDLEAQTFPDESFDLVVTQDVFEHLFDPASAIREIVRTLKPGGAHIFTVPIVNGSNPSRRRARKVNGQVEHLLEPQYHGDPMSENGSLVTIDWGYDILHFLSLESGVPIVMVDTDDLSRGIRGRYSDVLMAQKPLRDRVQL